MPAVTIYWYEGSMAGNFKPPADLKPEDVKDYNEIFIGTKGYMGTTGRGEGVRLVPESKMKGFKKPPHVLERSPGHFENFIQACKGGPAAGSNFIDHAAHLAEVVLLGNIAIRTKVKLLWDGPNQRFTNYEDANALINPPYRTGWSV